MILSVFCLQINKSRVRQLILRKILFDIELARLKQKMEIYFDKNPFLYEDKSLEKFKLPCDKIFQKAKKNYYRKYNITFNYYNKLINEPNVKTEEFKQENSDRQQVEYDAAICNLKNEYYIFTSKKQGYLNYLKY